MIHNKFMNTLTKEQAYTLYETHAGLEEACTEFWNGLSDSSKDEFLKSYAVQYTGYNKVKNDMKLFHACCMEEVPYKVLKEFLKK